MLHRRPLLIALLGLPELKSALFQHTVGAAALAPFDARAHLLHLANHWTEMVRA